MFTFINCFIKYKNTSPRTFYFACLLKVDLPRSKTKMKNEASKFFVYIELNTEVKKKIFFYYVINAFCIVFPSCLVSRNPIKTFLAMKICIAFHSRNQNYIKEHKRSLSRRSANTLINEIMKRTRENYEKHLRNVCLPSEPFGTINGIIIHFFIAS